MADSEGSGVDGPKLGSPWVSSVDEEFVDATLDFTRARVSLIFLGTLTVSESKPILYSTFSTLGVYCPMDIVEWFMSLGDNLELQLARWDAVTSVRPAAEAAD